MMKKTAFLLALVALAACQESITSPEARLAQPSAASHFFYAPDNPPPPPNDTMSAVSSESGTSFVATSYLINKTGTNGFISFQATQPAGTIATPNARISYHQGTFSGRGFLTLNGAFGSTMVDLSSVAATSSFRSCDFGCFSVQFNTAYITVEGVTRKSTAPVYLYPAKRTVCDCEVVIAPNGE